MMDARLQDLLNTASRLRELGRLPEAIEAYRALLSQYPALPDSWYNLGWLLRQAGQSETALAAYSEALARGITGPEEVHLNRAAILSDSLAQPDAARAELEAALALKPDYLPALINLSNLHEDLGDREQARRGYERALKLAPNNAMILSRLAGLGRASAPDDPMILKIRSFLTNTALKPDDKAQLLYALGRLYDTCGAYSEAAQAFDAANISAKAAAGNFQPYSSQADLLRADQNAAAFSERPPTTLIPSHAHSPQPIFIVGMFRSGSTLLEQILGAHSQVTASGELDLIPRISQGLGSRAELIAHAPEEKIHEYSEAYLSRIRNMFPSAEMITDKRPDNFWHIGLIKRLFPAAKIIHTIRHPLDTLISVWSLHLDASMNYGFRVGDTAAHIHTERRMMAHWTRLYPGDILPVRYEALIHSPEEEIRRVSDFLGLPFEAGCLDFYKSKNHVRTASVWQVREPLHDKSIGRWRNYEDYLRSLLPDPALEALLAVEPPAKPS